MEEKKRRLDFIDMMKGVLIVLMVIGHTNSPYTPFIYLFHMGAFFIISGFLYNDSKYTIKSYIKKQIKGLLLPYFVVNILFLIFARIINKFLKMNVFFNIPTIKSFLLYSQRVDIGDATWFLLVLFYSSILSAILLKCKKKINLKYTILVLFFISVIINQNRILLPYMLDLSFYGTLYFLIGFIIKEYNIISRIDNNVYIFFISIGIMYYFFKISYIPISWAGRDFRMPFDIFICLSGTYLVYLFSKIMINLNLGIEQIKLLGRKSLSIMIFHFLGFRLCFCLLYNMGYVNLNQISTLILESKYPFWPLVIVFGLLISLVIDNMISLSNRAYLIILGRKIISESKFKRNIKIQMRYYSNNSILLLVIVLFIFNLWVLTKFNFFMFNDYSILKIIKYSSLKEILFNQSSSTGLIFLKFIYELFKLNYEYHHLILLFIHIMTSIGVYKLSKNLFESKKIAFYSGIIFGMWPISTMTFLSDSFILDLLVGFFSILILNIFIVLENKSKKMKFLYSGLIIILYYLGLKSKETIIILPLILLIYEILKSIKYKKNKVSFLTIILNIITVLCLKMILSLKAANIIFDIKNSHHHTFKIINLIKNFCKYIILYFDINNSSFTYTKVSFISLFFILIIILFLLYYIFIKKENYRYQIIWIIGNIVVVLVPILFNSEQYKLYLYLPSIFLSIIFAIFFENIIKIVKLKMKYDIFIVLVFLIIVNFFYGGRGFRDHWKHLSIRNYNSYKALEKLNISENSISNFYIDNVISEDNVFSHSSDSILKMLYGKNINVEINSKQNYDLTKEYMYLSYNNLNGDIKVKKYILPKIDSVSPNEIKKGVKFNLYNNKSVIIVEGSNILKNSKLVINNTELSDTVVAGKIMTAFLPNNFYDKTQILQLRIKNKYTNNVVYSEKKEIIVKD